MRYLICETDWASVAIAKSIEDSGTLLTRTDSPDDLTHFLRVAAYDLVITGAEALSHHANLASLQALCAPAPVVILARAPTSDQVARWLDVGAAAVIDTRTDPAAILAQCAAVARRAHGLCQPRLDLGGIEIDLTAHTATGPDGDLPLAPKIYEMLEYMALRPNRLVARDDLLGHIYPIGKEPSSRIFDVFIHHLRRQLRDAGDHVRIETARGAGFRLSQPRNAASSARAA